jgi:hypothetical protein
VEGALGEFPGPRAARAELQATLDQRLEDHGAAVALQFEDVFAGIGLRSGKEQRDADVDGLAGAIEEARQRGVASLGQQAHQRRGDLGRLGSRDAHDADTPAPCRCCRCHDGVGMAHEYAASTAHRSLRRPAMA